MLAARGRASRGVGRSWRTRNTWAWKIFAGSPGSPGQGGRDGNEPGRITSTNAGLTRDALTLRMSDPI